jgi:hypothetical protein
LLTESLVAKWLGQSRPDSKDALYQMLFEELGWSPLMRSGTDRTSPCRYIRGNGGAGR